MLSELNSFREWFHGYENQYVIIGGQPVYCSWKKQV